MKIAKEKYSIIRNEIRMAFAKNPMLTVADCQQYLFKRGFQTYAGNPLNEAFVSKMIKKTIAESKQDIDMAEIKSRMAEVKTLFQTNRQRLAKIAYWEWEYLNEGIPMPTPAEQAMALKILGELELKLLDAEMNAGIYSRKLGTVEVEVRNKPLDPSRKATMIEAIKGWGLQPKQIESKQDDGPKQIATIKPADTATANKGVVA